MFFRIIRKDMAKSKLITVTTTIFVAAAAMLVSLAAILAVNLAGAIDNLMTQSKTPHFLQMHAGDIDLPRLEAFAQGDAGRDKFQVEAFQAAEFLNVDSARIVIGGSSLSGSVQDNGFATQSDSFDYLLDLEGNVIQPSAGEVYVPIAYMKDGTAKIGDIVEVHGKELVVAGFLRDSQMNSLLASSKRFLVSKEDYAELEKYGTTEYLIEFRLQDSSQVSELEAAYTAAKLEANGPALTYPLFKMLNAISDGIMIAVICMVSLLVVAIAMMCIRFTLLAKIEDDYREIGVMKAIGLRLSDIKKIYLAKYAAIAAAGSILGFALSFLFRGTLLENVRLYMGESKHASLAIWFGLLGVTLVFLAIVGFVSGVLRRFRRLSASEALRFGASQEKKAGFKRVRLSRNRWMDSNIFLGIKDVLSRKGIYATMLSVLVIATFIMIVPQNLHHTISSKGFIAYLGIGQSDIRIDIQQTDRIADKANEIAAVMKVDSSISRYVVLTTKTFYAKMDGGTEERIKVELGNHSVFPLNYASGKAPVTESEIALSSLNAKELVKEVGDTITLVIAGKEQSLTVSGIYSDVTNGGKTAKAVFSDDSADTMWSVVSAELSDKSMVAAKVAEYGRTFSFAKVSDIDQFASQTFGSTISSVGTASKAAVAVALAVMVLVTLLFMKMLVAKDRGSIAIMKAIGFTNKDIMSQYASRSIFVLVLGIVIGTLLSGTLGEALAGGVISSLGASTFSFEINTLSTYLLLPVMMVGAVLLATLIGTSGTGKIVIADHIKE
ncbi:ABC transporter permease [Paenibacillus oryzae]|uniref:ABC transporter permease n=1 Tax=Paenibacillus oryzae TaxID=1844972 RepID=A0A1A5YLQ0_9BACL|nr:FtsX-like permease family protein [Paenibacillus oryzae]OBR66542.1 ABC transporter permease [Paenibacillus oryzae]